MRLRFFCANPIALPAIIVATAMPNTEGYHHQFMPGNPCNQTRIKDANAAALTVAAM